MLKKSTDLIRSLRFSRIDPLKEFASDVMIGLCSMPKYIPAKYFYNDRGSYLFQKITKQDEYYLTRSEMEILRKISDILPTIISDKEIDIIELGPGDGYKSKIIIDGFLRFGIKIHFYPIDISEKALNFLSTNISPHPHLNIHAIVGEYFEGLSFVKKQSENKKLVLFLGSNIGNFNWQQNKTFLQCTRMKLNIGDYLIIGFDLKKDISTLMRAYNDTQGFTREFNLNILTRMNEELGGKFNIKYFEHLGVYNPIHGAMESYLISNRRQEIYVSALQCSFNFEEYEALHLEHSFKFLERDINYLCSQTGFQLEESFYDKKRYFADSLWHVKKS